MLNEMQVFRYESNDVRTTQIDGEIWFVLKDVCKALDISKYREVKNRLDEDERAAARVDTPGGEQNIIVVSEPGLYNVIFRSDKEKAKPFRRWVTHEVLPSIRKNGGYIANQESKTNEEILANAVLVAQNIIESKDKRIESLEPKAAYFENVVEKPELITTSTIASLYGWTAQKMNTFLEFEGVQMKAAQGDRWQLTDKYAGSGYAKRMASRDQREAPRSGALYWTQKGREFIEELLESKGIKPVTTKEEFNT